MCCPRSVSYELAHAFRTRSSLPRGPVLYRNATAAIPVGPDLVMGFICLPLCFGNPLACILQAAARFRQCVAAYQAEILGAASGAEMADDRQTQKMIPFITCEVPFSQHVCELVFGVHVTD